MAKRPANLTYGVDDRPPLSALVLLGVQHIFLMASTLVLPVVLVNEIGGSFEEVRAVVALSMLASGIGTILQAFRWGILGSGYLCPNLVGPNFFTVSMETVKKLGPTRLGQRYPDPRMPQRKACRMVPMPEASMERATTARTSSNEPPISFTNTTGKTSVLAIRKICCTPKSTSADRGGRSSTP